MAKPVTNIPQWADDSNGGNYTGGPYAGQPRKVSIPGAIAAEGFRPGAADPSAAEHVNDWLDQLSKWITWVFDGTSDPDESAHLVETTSGGRLQAQWGSFYASTAAAPYSLSSQSPAASGNALLLYADGPNTDPLISALHDNSGAFAVFEGGAGISLVCHGNSNDGITITTDGDLARGVDVATSGDGANAVHAVATGSAVNAIYGQVDDVLANAVQGIALSDGTGGKFTGGVASGFGLTAEGKANAGISCTGGTGPTVGAIMSTGKLDAPGGIFTGGPSGADGVQGVGIGLNAAGVRGQGSRRGVIGSATGGLVDSFGVLGTGTGLASGGGFTAVNATALVADSTLGTGKAFEATSTSGVAVDATSTTGHAVEASATTGDAISASTSSGGHAGSFTASGAKATVRLVPRGSDPGTVLEGGLWVRTAQGIKAHIDKGGGAAVRHLFDTAGGMAFAADYAATESVDDTPEVVLEAVLTGGDAPVTTGTVLVRTSMEVERDAGTPDLLFELIDQTANVKLVDVTVKLFQSAGSYERFVSYEIPYVLPAAGARTFRVRLTSSTTDDVNIRHASLVIVGVF